MKKMIMIGNAHLDPAWLWQWQEGFQEIKATFQSALDRMNETEDFIFTCACAAYYQWVEENSPDIFQQIKERVAQGRWIIVGGMWIQPDMNTPSGESFVRQLLYSQRYFNEKFGKTATVGYNVDSFGHCASMPQIYSLAGIDNYVWMRPSVDENPAIPEGAMIWEGIDGTQMWAYRIHGKYTRPRDIPEKIQQLFDFSERIDQPVMCFYGVGNHGGGPTIESLCQIHEYQSENERGKDVVFGSPADYFQQLKDEKSLLPLWCGELQHHASGCYSTHSASKFLHRTAENSLLRMEALGVLSNKLTGHNPNKLFVRQAWNNLMFNEFHDIMGGCCIKDALEDSITQLHEAISIAQREENALLQKISWKVDTSKGNPIIRSKTDWSLWEVNGQGTPVVVFNPHSFEAEDTIRICRPIRAVRDESGKPVPVQTVRASRTNKGDHWDGIFRAKVPALGYRLYWVFLDASEKINSSLCTSTTVLENKYIRAEFDLHSGALCSLVNKRSGFDPIKGTATIRVIDIESCDTWAHNVFRFDKEVGEFSEPQVTLLEEGPVRAVLEVKTYRFAFHGKACHAGFVFEREHASAIDELGQWICALNSLRDREKGTSVNVAPISGGQATNIVADEAMMECEMRFYTEEEGNRIKKAVEALAAHPFVEGVTVEVLQESYKPAWDTSEATAQYVKQVLEVAKSIDQDFKVSCRGGLSDANTMAQFCDVVLDGMGPRGRGGHSLTERLDTSDIEPSIKLCVALLDAMTAEKE